MHTVCTRTGLNNWSQATHLHSQTQHTRHCHNPSIVEHDCIDARNQRPEKEKTKWLHMISLNRCHIHCTILKCAMHRSITGDCIETHKQERHNCASIARSRKCVCIIYLNIKMLSKRGARSDIMWEMCVKTRKQSTSNGARNKSHMPFHLIDSRRVRSRNTNSVYSLAIRLRAMRTYGK